MPAKSHGGTGTRLYCTWENMRARCNRKSAREYQNYGGRGITVCDEWLHSFESFREWALSNGYDENLTIDRIDVDRGYCPDNCRWITNLEQQSNRRDNRWISYNGETKTISQWAKILGINYKTLQGRLDSGNCWNVEKAFTTPVAKSKVINMVGMRFGALTVVSLADTNHGARWNCICDCGNSKVIRGDALRAGQTKTCGCHISLDYKKKVKT